MPFDIKQLFGVNENDIKPVCVLMPFLTRTLRQQLNLTKPYQGNPYRTYFDERFTVIETKMGPLFTGDAILALNNTACKTIIFVGTCGSLDPKEYPIGAIVTPDQAYAMESFTSMLLEKPDPAPVPTNNIIVVDNDKIKKARSLSIGSIILQTNYSEMLEKNNIDIIDMECASVLAASQHNSMNALPLLHVADIINQTSPFSHNAHQLALINQAQYDIAGIIDKFMTG